MTPASIENNLTRGSFLLKWKSMVRFSTPVSIVPVLFGLVLLGGCIGFPLKSSEVVFINPYQYLGVIPVAPNKEEKAGIQLRLKPSYQKIEQFHEETTLFAKIQNGKGVQMQLVMDRTDRYATTEKQGVYRLLSETTIENQGGKLIEEKDLNERGEIVRLIRGTHRSKIGTFEVMRWNRQPIYPEREVKIGDQWNYEELLEVRLKSAWVKEVDPEPFQIQARSILKGFAIVKGRRCAIIETSSLQSRKEHLKLFFKKLIFNMESQIQQTIFLDYEAGHVIATITQIHSRTTGINVVMDDEGQSQSISYVVI